MVLKPVLKACKHLLDTAEIRYCAALRTRQMCRPLGLERLVYCRRQIRYVRAVRRYRKRSELPELRATLRDTNLVFAVTAGRSGTTFVHKLLTLLPNVRSEHEPDPSFHGYLRRVQRRPQVAREFLQHYKLPAIAGLGVPNYVELSHVFCLGFLEPLLDLGITPNLLLLGRDPRLVAQSFLERYTIPERTFLGMEWLISPRFAGRLPLPGWRQMTDYQLVFWYALEVERRQRDYCHLVCARGGIVAETTAAELHDFACFSELARSLGLLGPQADLDALARRHAAVCRVSWNRNAGPLWHYQGDFDREEAAVWQAVSAADPQLRPWVEARYRRPLREAA